MISTAVVAATSQDVTDIAIDFGDRTAAAAPATFTIFAGIRDDGVYRAVFDRAANAYRDLNAADHPFRLVSAAAGVKWTQAGRIVSRSDQRPRPRRLGRAGTDQAALCECRPRNIYAIFFQTKTRTRGSRTSRCLSRASILRSTKSSCSPTTAIA